MKKQIFILFLQYDQYVKLVFKTITVMYEIIFSSDERLQDDTALQNTQVIISFFIY